MTVRTKRNNRLGLIVFLGMLAAIAPLSTDMYLPSLPSMPAEFSAGTSLIQLTLTMNLIGMSVGQMLAGPISDVQGRRKPLLLGMLIFSMASLACAFAENIWVFLFFRLVQGMAGAAGIVIGRAIARDLCEGEELTRFFSILMLVNGFAPILAPVLGGQILLFTSWRAVFVVLTLIGAVLAFSSFSFRETLPSANRLTGFGAGFRSFQQLLQDRYFLGQCLMQCFAFAAFFAYIAGSSFLFQNVYSVSAQAYSFIFGGLGLAMVTGGALPARLVGLVTSMTMLKYSLWQAFIGSALFFACCCCNAPLFLVIIALLLTIPTLAVMGAASFSLAMQSQGKNAGSASALIGFFSMLAGGLMAPLVGVAGSHTAMPMAVIMILSEFLALAVFYICVKPRKA